MQLKTNTFLCFLSSRLNTAPVRAELYRADMISGFSTDGKSNPLQIKQKMRRAAESRCSRRIFTRRALSIIKSIVLFGSCLILFHNHNIVHGVPNTKSLTRVHHYLSQVNVKQVTTQRQEKKTRQQNNRIDFLLQGKCWGFCLFPASCRSFCTCNASSAKVTCLVWSVETPQWSYRSVSITIISVACRCENIVIDLQKRF